MRKRSAAKASAYMSMWVTSWPCPGHVQVMSWWFLGHVLAVSLLCLLVASWPRPSEHAGREAQAPSLWGGASAISGVRSIRHLCGEGHAASLRRR